MNPQALRNALGKFATGIAISTTVDASGAWHGLTINSFSSVSLDPPLVLFCIDKKARVFSHFLHCHAFGISVLSDTQQHLSQLFASGETEKFASVATYSLHTGVPLLQESLSTFDCELFQWYEGGDHLIFVGKVVGFESREGNPLLYYGGNYSLLAR